MYNHRHRRLCVHYTQKKTQHLSQVFFKAPLSPLLGSTLFFIREFLGPLSFPSLVPQEGYNSVNATDISTFPFDTNTVQVLMVQCKSYKNIIQILEVNSRLGVPYYALRRKRCIDSVPRSKTVKL